MARELKELEVLNIEGVKKDSVQVDVSSLDVKKSERLVSDVVSRYLDNTKKHTACVKSRGEVSYSKRKQRKQKGSGMARAGTRSNPVWVGGAVAFGPKPRDVRKDIPKKQRKKALLQAVLLKVIDGDVIIVDELKLNEAKTKSVVALLESLKIEQNVLIVTNELDSNLILAVRNLKKVRVIRVSDLNAYEVVLPKKVLFAKDAFDVLSAGLVA